MPNNIDENWIKEKLKNLKYKIYFSPFLISSDVIKIDPIELFP